MRRRAQAKGGARAAARAVALARAVVATVVAMREAVTEAAAATAAVEEEPKVHSRAALMFVTYSVRGQSACFVCVLSFAVQL